LFGFFWFFLLLFSYYLLRPIREQIASLGGTGNLSILFWLALLTMLLSVPLFSFLVSHFGRKVLVPLIYVFFASILILFSYQLSSLTGQSRIWLERSLFIFVSVYGLFLVSFFWSVMADMFNRSQSGRAFGVIASGGTVGGIVGSFFARTYVADIGVSGLLVVAACSLVLAIFVYFLLERAHAETSDPQRSQGAKKGTGGNPFAGFWEVLQSPFLLQIASFVLLLGACSTAFYFQQAEIVKNHFSTFIASGSDMQIPIEAATTEYFANINLWVSFVTVILQFFVFRFFYQRFGVTTSLLVLPCMYVAGLFCLGMYPSIEVLSVFAVLGRACEYGIFNPSKESLFTVVRRSERYKAKNFIDTVVRRSGDSVVGSVYRGLRESLHLPGFAIAFGAVPIALLTCFLGYVLGRTAEKDSSR